MKQSEFFAPAPLVAVAVLGLNDHLGKPVFHNAVTGKLTDLAACFFLPLLVSTLLRPLWRRDAQRLLFAALFAGGVYAAIKLSLTADAWLGAALALVGRPLGIPDAVFTRDLTDLLALVMVPVAYWYGRRRLGRPAATRPRWLLRGPALGATLLLLAAESPPNKCDTRSAPVTFRVGGECGQAGIIVVQGEGFDGDLQAANGKATVGAQHGQYIGSACPFRLDTGEWYLEGDVCLPPTPDGGAPDAGAGDAGGDAGALAGDGGAFAGDAFAGDSGGLPPGSGAGGGYCPPQQHRRCDVTLENGELWMACQRGGPTCRARLTVVEGQ